MTRPEEISYIEKTLYDYVDEKPYNRVTRGDSWVQVVTPGDRSIVGNGIFRSVLSESEADARIRDVIDEYRREQVPFRWLISPITQPKDLGERLLRAGMTLGYRSTGMIARFTDVQKFSHPSISVEPVRSSDVRDFVRIVCACLPGCREGVEFLERDIGDSLGNPSLRSRYFLARHEGRAAGTSWVRLLGGFGYLMGGAVLPEFRHKGIYRAMVTSRARYLHDLGIDILTLQADLETSAPICRKLGFRDVCGVTAYFFHP